MEVFKLDFIGIGAHKAGTSWLNEMLRAHPQICTAEPKEAHFFQDRLSFGKTIINKNYAKGVEWYKLFFRHCPDGKIKGEITTKYLIDPIVPSRIKELFPDIKLILCLRSPVKRAASQYYFERYFTRREIRPISEAIRVEPEYVDNGMYFKHLQYFLRHFDLSRFHFIWFEDIEKEPEKVVAGTYQFLNVDSSFVPPHIHRKSNAAKQSRSKIVRDIIHRVERGLTEFGFSRIVGFLKRNGISRVVAFFTSRDIQYAPVNEADKAWLLEQFREDILSLQHLTGRDLTAWLK